MKLKENEDECQRVLGNPFTEVHLYLDQFFKYYGWKHRCKLHHKWGVELVRLQFGEEAAKAATLHVLSDMEAEGLPRDEELMAKDEEEYLKIRGEN